MSHTTRAVFGPIAAALACAVALAAGVTITAVPQRAGYSSATNGGPDVVVTNPPEDTRSTVTPLTDGGPDSVEI